MKKRERGFTLVDVAASIALIGILAAMALPRFTAAAARAKRVEARTGLNAIWKAQKIQFARSGKYARDLNELGFMIGNEGPSETGEVQGRYYTFRLSRPWGEQSYYALAEGNIDRDTEADLLVIYEMPAEEETTP